MSSVFGTEKETPIRDASLESEVALAVKQARSHPGNQIGRDAFRAKEGSEGGGRDVVEATFDVHEEGGNFGVRTLVGPNLMCKGSRGIEGAESNKRATLV